MNALITYNQDNKVSNGIFRGLAALGYKVYNWDVRKSIEDRLYKTDFDVAIIEEHFLTQRILSLIKKYKVPLLPCSIDKQTIKGVSIRQCSNDDFKKGSFDQSKQCYALYLSNYPVGSKETELLMDMISLVQERDCGSYIPNIKIIGRYKIDLPYYIGETTLEEAHDFIASASNIIDYNDNYINECQHNDISRIPIEPDASQFIGSTELYSQALRGMIND